MLQRTALKLVSALTLAPILTTAFLDRALAQKPVSPILTDLPADAAAVVTVETSFKKWAELGQFQLIPEIQSLASLFFGFSPAQLENLKPLNEVVAWLGDGKAAIVLMPTKGTKSLSMESNFVFLVPVKDAQRFDEFLGLLQDQDDRKLVERQYKGVSLLELPPKPTETEEPTDKERGPLPAPPSPTLPTTQLPSPQQLLQPGLLRPDILTVYRRLFYPAGLASRSILAFQAPTVATKPESKPTPPPVFVPKPDSQPDPNEVPAQEAATEPELVIAKLPGYIAFSNKVRPVEQLVDAKEEPSRLVENAQFQKTLNHSKFDASLLSIYLNLPEVVQFSDFLMSAENMPDEVPVPLPLPSQEELEKRLKTLTDEYSTVDGFFWLDPNGLRTQTNTYYQKARPEKVLVATPEQEQILKRIPAVTYLLGTGRNLKQDWAEIVQQFETEEDLKDLLRQFRNAAKLNVGLDLDRDVIPWLDGEYALVVYPSRQSLFNAFFPNLNLGTAVLLQTSQRSAAEIALKRLNQFVRVKSNGEVTIVSRKIRGIPVTSWEAKDGNQVRSFFSYSWVDEDTLVLAPGVGSLSDLVPKPWQSIDQDYTFQTATASFERPNNGYFFINFGAALSWAYSLIPYDDFPGANEVKRIIGTLRSVSATVTTTAEKEQFDSILVLAPTRPPKSAAPTSEPSPIPTPETPEAPSSPTPPDNSTAPNQ